MKYKTLNLLIVFLCFLASVNTLLAADSRGNLSDTQRCVKVNSQDIEKICYNLDLKWRFEPIAFKAKFRLEPSFKLTKIHWKSHINPDSSAAKKKQRNILLGQSIFAAKVANNKWFIFTTQKIQQNKRTVQSRDLKWAKMVAKSCGDNNIASECSCFTNEANRSEKVSPFYISGATSKDLLRDGFELSHLKPCRLNIAGIIKEKNAQGTNKTISSGADSSGNEKIATINEEVFYWNLIKRNPSLSKYQEYVKDYPNGRFVAYAKKEIARYNFADNRDDGKNTRGSTSRKPIAICHSLLSKNQLTSGKSGNANSCFKAILKKQPDNAEAKSGLEAIEKRYAGWANNALNSGNNKKLELYINKIKLVNPDSPKITELRQKLAAKQLLSVNTAEEKIAEFQTAISNKDITQAEKLLAQIKKSDIKVSKYTELNNQFIAMADPLYYSSIKQSLDNNQLKEAKLKLDKFEKIALDRSAYIELTNLYFTLMKDADKAHLKLTTNIAGSRVEINGIDKGATPLKASLNKGETYRVKVTKRGYETQVITMTLHRDRDVNLEMTKSAQNVVRNNERVAVVNSATPAVVVKKAVVQLPVTKDAVTGIEMVSLKRGCFTMGSPRGEQRRDFDEKQHKVCFKRGFNIGRYEITQQQWQAVMGRNPSSFDDCGADCPVENVDWHKVQQFIKKLNRDSDFVYRLPTEAEWEYAARAGTTTPFNTGSCLLPEQANYKLGKVNCIKTDGQIISAPVVSSQLTNFLNLAKGKTKPVGSYPPNDWGLYDMHGNVREWTCSEYFHRFNGSEKRCHASDISITGAVDNSFQISNRGGSWGYQYQWARSAERDKDLPTSNNKNLGFRLVRE